MVAASCSHIKPRILYLEGLGSSHFIVPLRHDNCGLKITHKFRIPSLTLLFERSTAIMRDHKDVSLLMYKSAIMNQTFFLYGQIDMSHYIMYHRNSIRGNKSGPVKGIINS